MTKVDAGSFNAFSSPNLAPLATAEIDITSKQAKSCKTPSVYQVQVFFCLICLVHVVFSQLGHRVESQYHSQVSSLH